MDKSLLKILGVSTVALGLFAFKKKTDYEKVIEQMTIDIRNVHNLRTKNAKLYLDLDIGFHNPTQYDFDLLTVGAIAVKQIIVFHKGVKIGTASTNPNSNDNSFELPAKGNFLLTNISVELLFLDIVSMFANNQLDFNVENYQVHIQIQALGKTWLIE